MVCFQEPQMRKWVFVTQVMNAQVAVECSENRARLDLEHVATVSF
jgi:hypothetical protein